MSKWPPMVSWRIAALGEVDRLQAQLAASTRASNPLLASDPDADSRLAAIREGIAKGMGIAKEDGGGLLDWWNGTSIESAWQTLHRSQEELILVLPVEDLLAQGPHLQELIRSTFTGDRQKVEIDDLAASTKEAPNRLAARRVLGASHAKSDDQHQRTRGLRNQLYLLLLGLTAITAALWIAGVTSGPVVGLGALAGALSVVFAVRAGIPSGPYNLVAPQALLKVAAGAAVALSAVKILDVVSGATVTTARDCMYAVVFGFSQQAFTRLVDQQASALTKGSDSRSSSGSIAPTVGTD